MGREYSHLDWCTQQALNLPVPSKVVCIGRNYHEHIKELDNAVPTSPVLFLKPSTAVCAFEDITIQPDLGEHHYELELAILIKNDIDRHAPSPLEHLWGVGLGLDLTLRRLQSELKSCGLPWEKAKSFDGSCPLAPFVPLSQIEAIERCVFELDIDGDLVQSVHCGDMIHSVSALIEEARRYFTLRRGDVILTGTPAGVGRLKVGQRITAILNKRWRASTVVR